MDELITGFVGLDAHAESTAIGFAAAGRAAPRFIGTVGPKQPELTKALGRLGEPRTLLIVYEVRAVTAWRASCGRWATGAR